MALIGLAAQGTGPKVDTGKRGTHSHPCAIHPFVALSKAAKPSPLPSRWPHRLYAFCHFAAMGLTRFAAAMKLG